MRPEQNALVSMNSPKALLLDEPFAGITKEDVLRLSAVIKGFAEEGVGVCSLLSTTWRPC